MRFSHAKVLTPTDDNAALLQACRSGDAAAWEQLVQRYQRLIYTIPHRAGLNEDAAAEVFQRVWVTLVEHLDRIEQPDRLASWLATTARRETLRQIRIERPVVSLSQAGDEVDEPLQIVDTALLPHEVVEQVERQHTVREAMGELEDRCRSLLALLFYAEEPPPYAEVAARLGIPEGSIGPTRARCLRKLQRLIEERER